jgi:hypothetical protein
LRNRQTACRRAGNRDDPPHLEIIGQLEGQDRIGHSRTDLGHVLLRRHLVGNLVVTRDSPTDHDAAQVHLLAQFLARVIQPPSQAQRAVIGMDKDIDAVEHVTLGIMGGQVAVADDIPVR